jgi:hypothetical protein
VKGQRQTGVEPLDRPRKPVKHRKQNGSKIREMGSKKT